MSTEHKDFDGSFNRKLDTNYKYSCLVTMTMDLTKAHSLYKHSNDVAGSNKISRQKNYAISIMRLAILLRQSSLTLDNIFSYLGSRHEGMAREKFPNLSAQQMRRVQQKCGSDLSILRRAFECEQKDRFQVLLRLYKKGDNEQYNNKHKKQSNFLVKVMSLCLCGHLQQRSNKTNKSSKSVSFEQSNISSNDCSDVCKKDDRIEQSNKIEQDNKIEVGSIVPESSNQVPQIAKIEFNEESIDELSDLNNSIQIRHPRRESLSHYLMDQKLLEEVSLIDSKMDYFETLLAELDESLD